MNITKRGIMLMAAFFTLCSIAMGSQEQPNKQYQSSMRAFFAGVQINKVKLDLPIEPLARMPASSLPLQASKYPNVIREFMWWAKDMIRADCLPPDSFMKNNVILFKACKETGNADVAYLAYTVQGKHYMIAQTAWFFCLFLEDQSQSAILAAPDSQVRLRTGADSMLLPAKRRKIPAMRISVEGSLYQMKAENSWTALYCFAGPEAGLAFAKRWFREGVAPAHEPAQNEWFDYEESLPH